MNIPTVKHISDNLRIPIPTPDTVDIVAIAVMHQMIITCWAICKKNKTSRVNEFDHGVDILFRNSA